MPNPSSYVVILSGTHVTGKETLAVSLSQSLHCPWIKAEYAHVPASFGARSQARKGYDYSAVFGRIFFNKLRRFGLLSENSESEGESEREAPRRFGSDCTALLTCYAMRKPARDAIRGVLLKNSVRVIFVILQITEETLSGRTLGAETEEMAEKVMGEKIADIREPEEEERDILVVDNLLDVNTLFVEIKEGISRLVESVSDRGWDAAFSSV